jgi:hypothetical protein
MTTRPISVNSGRMNSPDRFTSSLMAAIPVLMTLDIVAVDDTKSSPDVQLLG